MRHRRLGQENQQCRQLYKPSSTGDRINKTGKKCKRTKKKYFQVPRLPFQLLNDTLCQVFINFVMPRNWLNYYSHCIFVILKATKALWPIGYEVYLLSFNDPFQTYFLYLYLRPEPGFPFQHASSVLALYFPVLLFPAFLCPTLPVLRRLVQQDQEVR